MAALSVSKEGEPEFRACAETLSLTFQPKAFWSGFTIERSDCGDFRHEPPRSSAGISCAA
jgi:hypothetical protein